MSIRFGTSSTLSRRENERRTRAALDLLKSRSLLANSSGAAVGGQAAAGSPNRELYHNPGSRHREAAPRGRAPLSPGVRRSTPRSVGAVRQGLRMIVPFADDVQRRPRSRDNGPDGRHTDPMLPPTPPGGR